MATDRPPPAPRRESANILNQLQHSPAMAQIKELLLQIRAAGIRIDITNDSRGVSPGGIMSLDLVRHDHRFATLSIRSFHEIGADFKNIDAYRITHLTIDNAEVIDFRSPKTAQQIWAEIY